MPRIKKFNGINNVDEPTNASLGDLQSADNVYVTDGGAIRRRWGTTEKSTDAPTNLFTNKTGYYMYYTDFTGLRYTINQTFPTALIDATVSRSVASLVHLENFRTVFSTSSNIYSVEGTSLKSFGIDPPTFTAAERSGLMPAGDYLVTVTYVASDGQESAAAETQSVTLTSTAGITVSAIPAPTDDRIYYINVYVSKRSGVAGEHGESLFLAETVDEDATGADLLSWNYDGKECRTLNMSKFPACPIICLHGGRLYGAGGGDGIVYSEPWSYELYQPDNSHLTLGTTIMSMVPVENGIWVGTITNGSMFVSGKNPAEGVGLQITTRIRGANCYARGTSVSSDKLGMGSARSLAGGDVALWVTSDGIMAGDANGKFVNITGDKWVPPDNVQVSSSGVPAVVLDHAGSEYVHFFFYDPSVPQAVCYAMNLDNGAVTHISDVVNGMAVDDDGNLFIGHGGISLASDSVDVDHAGGAGEADVDASVTKTGIDFDQNTIKKLTDIYFHMKSSGNLLITNASETGSGSVTLTDNISTYHGSKINLSRGVKGRDHALTIANVDGAFFEIQEMDIEVDASRSRRARQTGG